jgi:hypothetical protein
LSKVSCQYDIQASELAVVYITGFGSLASSSCKSRQDTIDISSSSMYSTPWILSFMAAMALASLRIPSVSSWFLLFYLASLGILNTE